MTKNSVEITWPCRYHAAAGERAAKRFVEFFTANITNKNTRLANARAVLAVGLHLTSTLRRFRALNP